jgi:hypothetical protein
MAGLFVLRALPKEVTAKIKGHLSQLDWTCYRAACLHPLKEPLGDEHSLDLHVREATRQEQALLSDPFVRDLFVNLSAKRVAKTVLHKVEDLPNLRELRLKECGMDAPVRCLFPFLRRLNIFCCTVDASHCPVIGTLASIFIMKSKVLLSREGHPFPWVSRDAHSLTGIDLTNCELVDVAGTGCLHIDAPELVYLTLSKIRFQSRSKTCSLVGPDGLSPRLLTAKVEDFSHWERGLRYTPAKGCFCPPPPGGGGVRTCFSECLYH